MPTHLVHGIGQSLEPSDGKLRIELVCSLTVGPQFTRINVSRVVPSQVCCLDGSNGSIKGLTA
ncbi:hypothetical protein [Streptomyces spinosisporus]|uniref:Uncharacterized protein n=1 Tax=Streptomyces spinosisporus TaxID=2927582 RepID=A0ABS9XEM6_9ACTN|nr:hypothetical protein [Streptomyces spinosisporus]MCI3240494.1 hypothetical protein [Streptomyces spinosisporus]